MPEPPKYHPKYVPVKGRKRPPWLEELEREKRYIHWEGVSNYDLRQPLGWRGFLNLISRHSLLESNQGHAEAMSIARSKAKPDFFHDDFPVCTTERFKTPDLRTSPGHVLWGIIFMEKVPEKFRQIVLDHEAKVAELFSRNEPTKRSNPDFREFCDNERKWLEKHGLLAEWIGWVKRDYPQLYKTALELRGIKVSN
ncbi:MAG: hypothetical protein V1676_07230 [Candidatus Diapherotrites archaeon]